MKSAYGAALVLLAWIALALLVPWLPLQPDNIDLEHILKPPDGRVWFGYDDLGRFIFDRLAYGAQTSMIVAASSVSISVVLGCLVGAVSGYYGGWTDHIIVRVMDMVLAFPGILLAIGLAGVLGPGIENVIIALVAVGWVGYARLMRVQVLSLKQRDHVSAAIALGTPHWRIVVSHILPLALTPVIVEASFGVAGAIIAEAGLSFLGLGVQPPEASWGNMIRDGVQYMLMAPHMVVFPGVLVMLVVLAANLLGDQVRDRLSRRQNWVQP